MKKNILFALSFLVLPLALGGCAYTTSVPANTAPVVQSPATTGSTQTPAVVNQSTKIDIQNFSFNPATLTIKQGATVTWANNDSVPHTIKSDTFNSELLNQGQAFSFVFKNIGTFNYVCSIHPSMTGTIIVQ